MGGGDRASRVGGSARSGSAGDGDDARASASVSWRYCRTSGARCITVVFVVTSAAKKVPLRRKVQATYWSVPKDEIPSDPAEMSAWLFDQWELVDQWIADHKPEVLKP